MIQWPLVHEPGNITLLAHQDEDACDDGEDVYEDAQIAETDAKGTSDANDEKINGQEEAADVALEADDFHWVYGCVELSLNILSASG
jgi:hypothetical protein